MYDSFTFKLAVSFKQTQNAFMGIWVHLSWINIYKFRKVSSKTEAKIYIVI